MNLLGKRRTLWILALSAVIVPLYNTGAELPPPSTSKDGADKLKDEGNYKEALERYSERLQSPDLPGSKLQHELPRAIECLQRLNRLNEFDTLVDLAVDAHPNDWRLLAAASNAYVHVPHYGYMIAGGFQRGQHRGGGKVMHATARDRVRALQLVWRAFEAAESDPDATAPEKARVAQQLASTLQTNRSGNRAWRLQLLTDLDNLPDYDEGWGYGDGTQGAPVDENNKPLFYGVPKTWAEAQNDGQRWRWALEQMVEHDADYRWTELITRGDFLRSQFGVTTLGGDLQPLLAKAEQSGETSLYSLHTLTDGETLARLATGVQRFALPDEHNFVLLYQQAFEIGQKSGTKSRAHTPAEHLARLFADRRQFDRSAEHWRQALEYAGHPRQKKVAKDQIDQIEKPWGQFEVAELQPSGSGATFEFRFRNAPQVEFTAHAVKVGELLADVKGYIKSRPRKFDWQKIDVGNIGHRLVREKQEKYIGQQVAQWTTELEPGTKHFDRRKTVTSPLQQAGAYLITAKVADGNTSTIVLWVADTAIVKKQVENATFYYIADAVTGQPIEKANLELFGYYYERRKPDEMKVDVKQFAEMTDADGQVVVPIADTNDASRHQWLAIATTPEGRLAYLGFHQVWQAHRSDSTYNQVKTFAITDRPVYRPEQKVHMKIWVERARYDGPDENEFAHKTFQLEIHDPKGERVYNKQLAANAYGGVVADFELPSTATLGQYQFHLVNYGGGTFRVEEYKKPEFQVTVDAPKEPLALGDKFEATIAARYYFGEPVREGTVKYKVTRTTRDAEWLPSGPWDWLYGRGYWWFGFDYTWYPGWARWGCMAPYPWWVWRQPQQPEIVAEGEAPLDADGKLQLTIDSALAKALHPDHDHDYRIEAQVVDRSRRTIVGSGSVLVARQPFEVYAWTDRGYYRTGDTIAASFQARRPDGEPVAGAGKLRLLSIEYDDDGKPIETAVSEWDLDTNSEGRAELQIKASEAGQYRLSYSVTSGDEKTIEGGYVFTIVGDGFDGNGFRFADLELVPDKRHYAPGDKLQLQINTNRRNGVVLLYLRSDGGVYTKPRTIRMDGKSTVLEIDVAQGDMPNFFVEAQTVSSGKVHTVVKQIVVPPAKRVVNVEVAPSAAAFQPGQEAAVKIRLTDEEGKPVVGDTVLTVYDQALEYISSGSNVGDIREAFWGWKRSHHPSTEDNLERYTNNVIPPGQTAMQSIGAFGYLVAATRTREGRGQAKDRFSRGAGAMRFGALAAPATAAFDAVEESAPMESDGDSRQSLFFSQDQEVGSVDAFVDSESCQMVEPSVRKEFADTAYWAASVETDGDGLAEVKFPMPENLTNWKFGVWTMAHGTRVGDGSATAVTRKNLLVRLQTPRFLVETDEVVLSANVHNYLPDAKQVRVRLELDGDYLAATGELEKLVEIDAGGETRVDWRLTAAKEGIAVVRALALTDEESDAMQLEIPVKVHGIEKLIPHSGVIAADGSEQAFEVVVPDERRVSDTRLEVQFSPTLAGAMVDALPYLIDYPYGCTEQTLNRFLPAVVTQQTLRRMGVDLQAIREKQTNLNPQELGAPAVRAEQWKRYKANPVFDEAELDKVVKAGVNRLSEMQLSDGGWGWFSGFGEWSSAHTTSVVVRGLVVAKRNDVAIVPGVLDRGIQWLAEYQSGELAKLDNRNPDGSRKDVDAPFKSRADNIDALVYLVLTEAKRAELESAPAKQLSKMRQYLYEDRTKLAVYSQATFGLALQYECEMNADDAPSDMRDMVLRNLSQYVVTDAENQTAYLNLPGGYWWYWYGSEYEAQAYYLKLLAANDPKGDTASGLVKYLLNNRKHASYWNSTRDTALVVEAMADYLAATGEGAQEMTVEVWLNGQRQKTVEITPEVLFSFDNRFVVEGGDIEGGRHTLELRKTGKGRLYYNAYLSLFSLEDDIKAAGLELKVDRKYYKLTPVDATADVAGGRGQAVSQKVEKYERTEVPNLGVVESGDLVEIELTVQSKNDYEYILLEDLKAAGFEPVEVRSGYNGNDLGAYMELRDDRVSLFVRSLARGTHSVSYRMRAETPGKFSALPTKAYAMYAPELKANSNEIKVRVVDED